MKSKATPSLDERIESWRDRPTHDQFVYALDLILNSPNGIFKKVFSFLEESDQEARDQLKKLIDPQTGLMQEAYFARKVMGELYVREMRAEAGRPVKDGTYVLLNPENVEAAKTHLKTNEFSQTRLIGTMDGIMSAFLKCDVDTAQKVMEGCKADYVLVPYEVPTSFGELHLQALKMYAVLGFAGRSDTTKACDLYIGRKNRIEKTLAEPAA